MYGLVYKLYFFLKRTQKVYIDNGKNPFPLLEKCIDRIEWYYNKCVRDGFSRKSFNQYGLNTNPRPQKIIISLTSFPKRINTVWITIETLLRQSVKPDEIVLWLADKQFDGLDSLPTELLVLQKRGLTIRFCEDLRSHKKYFYAMQEFPDAIVVLVDDDMFYPRDMLKELLKLHKRFPNDICTMTAQVMSFEDDSKPSQWRNPRLDELYEHSDQLQIFTGSGSLYPPNALDEATFNSELIKNLCPFADDLWLTFMAHKKGTKITMMMPWRSFPVAIYGTSVGSLWYTNAEEGQNDIQWNSIKRYFEENTI